LLDQSRYRVGYKRCNGFDVPLKQDARRVYETQVEIKGERADIELPDGQHQIVRDHRIADWPGSFATFEASLEHGLTDSRVGFTEIWAQSLRVKRSGR
jgi:hypothetical protein